MAQGICDICGLRPATVRAQVVRNGHRETMELCDPDYRRLARQQGRPSSPLESLFGSGRGTSLFEDFFGSDFFGNGRSNVREDDDQTDEHRKPNGGLRQPLPTPVHADGGRRHEQRYQQKRNEAQPIDIEAFHGLPDVRQGALLQGACEGDAGSLV